MRPIQTRFIAVPVWVHESPNMTPTIMQVYLALGAKSLLERKPPKGIGWVMRATDLKRSTVYAALAALREMGAVVDSGPDEVWLPTDKPSTLMDTQSIQVDKESMVVDESSTLVDHTSLLENTENPEEEPRARAESLFANGVGASANGSGEKDPDYGFEKFWSAYPERKGRKLNKAEAISIWRKLTYDEKRDAWRGAKNLAVAVAAGDTYAPDAFRWLRKRSWPEWLEEKQEEAVPEWMA